MRSVRSANRQESAQRPHREASPYESKTVRPKCIFQPVLQKPKSKEAVSSLDYKVGDCVNHRVFGNGLVISMTAMANDTLVEVSFDRVGTKKIMANFAKLKKI